jgi:hypothetical protein
VAPDGFNLETPMITIARGLKRRSNDISSLFNGMFLIDI